MLTNPVFAEKPFISWDYTDTILLTAYDLLKNDPLIYELHSNSVTLREYLHDIGFPKTTKILADSGVFALEWIKRSKGKTFKQDYSHVSLKADQILSTYTLIDPDFIVPLDEIILPKDTEDEVKEKIQKIKNNILAALERFPTSKIIGVIQGTKERTMDEIYDFERSQGITSFARGGLIPIYRRNNLYCTVLRYTRQLTKGKKLHAFGVVSLNQLMCYGKCANVDSFDSTIARYLTTEFYYITPKFHKIRFNDEIIQACDCPFCHKLQQMNIKEMSFAGIELITNLYLHNTKMLNDFSKNVKNILYEK